MPKYLIRGSYSVEGTKGLMKAGGTARREAVKMAIESVGGKLESYYFALGEDDFVIVVDAPDAISVSAVSLAAGSSGAVHHLRSTVLLTPEEVDQVAKKSVKYRPPGQ